MIKIFTFLHKIFTFIVLLNLPLNNGHFLALLVRFSTRIRPKRIARQDSFGNYGKLKNGLVIRAAVFRRAKGVRFFDLFSRVLFPIIRDILTTFSNVYRRVFGHRLIINTRLYTELVFCITGLRQRARNKNLPVSCNYSYYATYNPFNIYEIAMRWRAAMIISKIANQYECTRIIKYRLIRCIICNAETTLGPIFGYKKCFFFFFSPRRKNAFQYPSLVRNIIIQY